MALIKKLIAESPELKAYTESPQYKLSLKLMTIRYELSFSPEQTADLLGLTLTEYVQLESGSTDIDASVYQHYLETLSAYI